MIYIYELFKKGNHEAFLIDIRNANIDDFGDVQFSQYIKKKKI